MAATVDEIFEYAYYRGAKRFITDALKHHRELPMLPAEDLLTITLEAAERMRPACADQLNAAEADLFVPALTK